MHFRLHALGGTVISLFPLVHALADAGGQSASSPAKVEVAAARYDQRRQDTASSIIVEHDELVRHGDRTLTDVLKRLPGITVGDRNGRGTEIRMRGLGSGYTQILLNGVAAPAGFTLESIAPDLIERIEILRTASADTGAQAIAGTINIVLRKAVARSGGELKFGVAAQGGRYAPEVGGQVSGSGADHAYTLAARLVRTRTASPSQEEDIGVDDSGRHVHRRTQVRESNKIDALSLSARIDWRLAGGRSLVSQTFVDAHRRTAGSETHEEALAGEHSRYPDNNSMLQVFAPFVRSDLLWTSPLGDGARLELKGGGNFSRRRSDFEFNGRSGIVRDPAVHLVASSIREGGLHFSGKYAVLAGDDHVLSFGWDTARAGRAQTRVERRAAPAGPLRAVGDDRYHGNLHRWALFAQDEWQIDAAWSLAAGLRWESLRTAVESGAVAPVIRRTAVASPVLQSLHKLSPERQLRIGLARTWKAPTMLELIPRRYTVDNNNSAAKPDTQGNPALGPEIAWGIDAVYDHHLGREGLLSASAFVRRIDDVILPNLFQDGAAWVSMPVNGGRALARGVALEAKFPLKLLLADAPAIELRANLARNWSRVDAVPAPHNRLDSQVPVSLNLGFDYRPRGSGPTLGADLHFRSGGSVRQSAETASWSTAGRGLDIYGLWALDGKTRLRIGASNLLRRDRRSEEHYRGAGGDRSTLSSTPTSATLRITLERESGD
ncbi:MAG TPA: TonB-dependent receptor [Paucimonas sp.]|nr:TonB-dependent receptor [Paucimonas sp.]